MTHRDSFTHRLQEALIGPGADVYGLDAESELLGTTPLNRYCSGMLYPKKKPHRSPGEAADAEVQHEADNAQPPETGAEPEQETEKDDTENQEEENEAGYKEGDGEPQETNPRQVNNYHPSNMGLTFCLAGTVESITLHVAAARYCNLSEKLGQKPYKGWPERQVGIKRHLYQSIFDHPDFPGTIKEALAYRSLTETDGILSMPHLPADTKPGDVRKNLDAFKRNAADKLPEALKRLNLLLSKTLYKRQPMYRTISIPVRDCDEIDLLVSPQGETLLRGYIRVVPQSGNNYVKILVANTAPEQAPNQFSSYNESLNEKTLFQVKVRVEADHICPYKDHYTRHPFDDEASRIAYQHRHVHSYGMGHGCAVCWEPSKTPAWIETTFLPVSDIPGVSNDFQSGQEHLRPAARLRNLSVWSGWNQEQTCDALEAFVEAYAQWVARQKTDATAEPADCREIASQLIEGQEYNLARLRAGVNLLRTNKAVFDCFRLANTAMYIQMVVSQDKRFSSVEKEWSDCEEHDQKNAGMYKSLAFFKEYDESDATNRKARPISYRPFQLAFLLLTLESTVNPGSPDRTDTVDLLWFPTGGGKTEAYLALTAFTILWRRLQFPKQCKGVSVIMRYTLRLLTAQQFERASRLIVALEFMRRQASDLPADFDLGSEQIRIGMWVGKASTPNTIEEAREKIGDNKDNRYTLTEEVEKANKTETATSESIYKKNPFQVAACPWCGCRVITKNKTGKWTHGFSAENKKFTAECRNLHCAFHGTTPIPLDVVDDSLYADPPALLFATVDKFARLPHTENGHVFFDSYRKQNLPPDLIIQDELHLLNGPLGSVAGLFELMVEMLCSREGRRPKIIASTATTRNTAEQVRNLYGDRRANVFPAPGLTHQDSYFSIATDDKRRRHVGFMAAGKPNLTVQATDLLPNLLFTRALLYEKQGENGLDPYWTIVSYYNSLRSVGKVYNKLGDEIRNGLRALHQLHDLPETAAFNYRGLQSRTSELTSRVESMQIKQTLKQLENTLEFEGEGHARRVENKVVDLVLCSNMFSVGVDVGRLNIMLMNGQPKNSAEYIQASSRVARSQDGLVINLLDANLAREKSYFENYSTFHQAYYRYVEPLTVTPFTEAVLEKALNSLLVCYVRHHAGLPANDDAARFKGGIEPLLQQVRRRMARNPAAAARAESLLNDLAESWIEKIMESKDIGESLKYENLINTTSDLDEWSLMHSMRETDTNSLIKISFPDSDILQKDTHEAEQETEVEQ